MPEQEKKESFWTTLPGMLTGLAALITAVTGLWLALAPHSSTPKPDTAAAINAGTSAAEPPAKPVLPSGGSAAQPTTSAQPATTTEAGPITSVVLTPRSGTPTTLSGNTFVHNAYDKSIELLSGQTISFEKIKAIDFLDVHYDQSMVDVKVTLLDGRVVTGDLNKNHAFKGDSDLGPFTAFMTDIKQVAFNR